MLDVSQPDGEDGLRSAARPVSRWRQFGRAVLPCLWAAVFKGSLVLLGAAAVLAILGAIPIVIFKTVDPPGSAVMLAQRLGGQSIDQRWVPLSQISPHLVRAVIASEDNQFCFHRGVDLRELEATLEKIDQMGEDNVRGGSTITMQVAKNLLLWNDRSIVRKAIELPLAFGIDGSWEKRRIMEVYLNIAEWGPGVFGAEAAAQYHFRKPASRLTEREAVLLAVALPNPHLRRPSAPSPGLLRIAGLIERRARILGSRAACVLGR